MELNEYVFIILWIGVVAVFAKYSPSIKKKELVCGVEEERFPWWFVLLLLVPLVWMAANRSSIGDTLNYRMGFVKEMPSDFSGLDAYMEKITKDSGFYLFSALIKIFVTKDYVVYFGILAVIQLVSVLAIYRKYSSNFVLSVFLFVVSSDYFSWTHNGIRQFTAATIIYAATALLLNKKYVPLIMVILLASTFHKSALIMLPIVFFVQGEALNKKNMALIIVVILVLALVGAFTNLLDDALADTQYSNVVSDYQGWNDNGTNPFRVAVYSVPALIAFVGRKKLKENSNKLINICINMSIVSSGLYFVSMVTSGIFLGRLPIYVSLYGYILLPWEMEVVFDSENRKIVYGALVVLYLIFYYYQMHISWFVF